MAPWPHSDVGFLGMLNVFFDGGGDRGGVVQGVGFGGGGPCSFFCALGFMVLQ